MKLAVVGDPIAHSRSPELHRRFMRDAAIAGSYDAIRVAAGTLAARLPELRALGYDGLNVTTPLKEEAYEVCDGTDESATFARAVNTLSLLPDGVAGANTDGAGAVAALEEAMHGSLSGALVLLLGTGPTARAAAFAIASAGGRLALWSRTAGRANALAAALCDAARACDTYVLDTNRARGTPLDDAPWPALREVTVAFATLPPDASIPETLRSLLEFVPCVVDANYGSRSTLGGALGRADIHDGSVMLAAQARASFEIWRAARTF